MIIAIPSVTSYIQNSRKSAYVDTAVGYMDAVMKEVNASKDLRFYSTNTLYLVSVGHDKAHSCVTVESGGQSPFSDEWKYAFVGVTYDGKGYSYYFISEDMAGQGISFIDKKELTDEGTDYIYSAHVSGTDVNSATATSKGNGNISDGFANKLKTLYDHSDSDFPTGKASVVYIDGTPESGSEMKSLPTGFKTVMTGFASEKEGSRTFSNVVFIVKADESTKCEYKEALGANN